MWIEQEDGSSSVVPTLLALGACALIAMIVVIDILGMVAQR